ncbi:MAG: CHASE2 domain-containing protein [Elusimicrobia bacterium]|nr:CHASE2 domain-containing protein [Elusimicrobiota bacterium]
MKKKTWLIDALLGLVISLFVAGSYVVRGAFMESLEFKAYDMRAKLRMNVEPPGDPVIIAIDDDSIANLGRWPWPRTLIAQMIDMLAASKAKVVGLNIVYSEPEQNPAIAEIEGLKARYLELVQSKMIVQRGAEFEVEFSSIAAKLDTDSKLLASLTTAQNVLLPMFFSSGGTIGGKAEELPAALSSAALTARVSRALPEGLPPPIEGSKPVYPILPFLEAAGGVGHTNIYPDIDGVVRREAPAVKYGDKYFPSYALALVARSLNLKPGEISIAPGQSISIDKLKIPLEDGQSMLVTFSGPDHTFRYYSFFDVLKGKVSLDVFKDKMVIIGLSASAVATLYVTPVAQTLPSVEFIANVVENILGQRFLVRPEWAAKLELGLIAFCGLFIMFGLPRLRALGGATVTTLLLAGILGAGFYLFVVRGEWVKVVYPSFLLVCGYLVIQTRRFVFTEKGKELVEASAIETNKMLGLSFQGQGMLDLAFEKFRLCPLDDNMKETLYNLSLDYERKRQYGKAVNVYKHISGADPKYKDIEAKIKTLGAAAEGAVFGGIGQKAAEGTVLITGGAQKPMLGRYEILKELGRGAMGIVYLGKDPKINRQVAIKTLMLEEGGTPEETKQIKERFFREAESAGTLNHPNIVRIFDAGEEQEVCYIAMELLDGHDLCRFCAKEGLLQPEVAMEYVARVADGLDYAHAQGIIHRDIKPANIMLLKDGSVRVADFGIARIAASSKTATGTVLGTPSYMSPEQIAGKKVDGRSDLFSLGVTLFELLVGEKPFKGGEGIGTLLFQIANDPEPEPLEINPKLARGVSRIIHKALEKKADDRYRRGSELSSDLRACIAAIKSGKDLEPEPPRRAEIPLPSRAPEAPAAAAAAPAPAPSREAPAAEPSSEPEEAAAIFEPAAQAAPQEAAEPAAVELSAEAAVQAAAEPVAADGETTIPIEAPEPVEALSPAAPVPAAGLHIEHGFSLELPGRALESPAPQEPAAASFDPVQVQHGFSLGLPAEPQTPETPAPQASSEIELGPTPGAGEEAFQADAAPGALEAAGFETSAQPSAEIELGPKTGAGSSGEVPSPDATIRLDAPIAFDKPSAGAEETKPAATKPLTPEEIAIALPVPEASAEPSSPAPEQEPIPGGVGEPAAAPASNVLDLGAALDATIRMDEPISFEPAARPAEPQRRSESVLPDVSRAPEAEPQRRSEPVLPDVSRALDAEPVVEAGPAEPAEESPAPLVFEPAPRAEPAPSTEESFDPDATIKLTFPEKPS